MASGLYTVWKQKTGQAGRARSRLTSRLGWLVLGIAALGGAAAAAVTYSQSLGVVTRVRVGNGADESRIVLEMDQASSARIVTPDGPSRHMVLVLPHVSATGDLHGAADGMLRQYRVEQAAGVAKVALDFDRDTVVRRRFLLPPDDAVKVYRYVIDFAPAPSSATDFRTAAGIAATAAINNAGAELQFPQFKNASVSPASAAPTPDARLAQSLPGRNSGAQAVITAPRAVVRARKVIVIDAGHGGKDPGAAGANSVEKDVSLAAARALRDRLTATGRYQVVLTRDTDVFIPLEQRVQIARRESADLFISLHADSIADPNLHGATVYTLSDKGADRVAKQVFTRSDWFINVDMHGKDPSVNRILLDLTQRETTNQSSGFANILVDRLGRHVDLLRRSHRDANYMVLLAPDVPAILLEMGFITNPIDELRLTSDEARAQMVDSVAEAIDAYFARQTRLAVR